jgi:excisionase family DNA binding protein
MPEQSPVNTTEAAKRTGLARSTLEKLRLTSGGPPYLKLGRVVRYRPADLDAWLQERVVLNTSQEPSK